jgi:hypothetical protein
MAQKIFKRVGLRRDKNLSDLSNPEEALNKLLDTLVDVPGFTFVTEDLNSIRNLFAEGMINSNYLEFANSATEVSVNKPDGSFANEIQIPRITYQNKLDIFEEFSGVPRLQGGDGLTANYYNFDQVFDKKSTSVNALSADDIFVGITTGTVLESDQLWDTGDFQYTGKIHPSSVNAAGGVKWEGFYIPTITAKYVFSVDSTAAFSFDFEDESYTSGINTYKEHMRVSVAQTSLTSFSTGTPTQITLDDAAEGRFIGIGMSVTGSTPSVIRSGTKVTNVDPTSGIITLSNPDGDPVTTSRSNYEVTFSRSIGTECTRTATTHVLNAGQRYRIRARFYIPQGTSTRRLEKRIQFEVSALGGTLGDLLFTKLYPLNYDFSASAKGSFIDFLDNSLRFGGGTVGGNIRSDYVKVKSSKKIDIRYVPKTNYAGIVRKAFPNASWTSGRNVIDPNLNTTNLEVGNYVYGTGIPVGAKIKEIKSNEFFVIDSNTTNGGVDAAIVCIDHRGFVKRTNSVNCSNGTLTVSNTIAGIFDSSTNTGDGTVVISKLQSTTGTCTFSPALNNAGSTVNWSSVTSLSSSEFTPGTRYTITPSTNMGLRFQIQGASGGLRGGNGASIDANMSLSTSVGTYTLIVGVEGSEGGAAGTIDQGGGGAAGTGDNFSYSGGGFTGLFETGTINQNNALIIAAGGGGAGYDGNDLSGASGGDGGSVINAINAEFRNGGAGNNGGSPIGGGGGTHSAGGIPNSGAVAGSALSGGAGESRSGAGSQPGGGGGGGFYGGGGGRGDSNSNPGGHGGGGGSSYINQSKGVAGSSNFNNVKVGMLAITDNATDFPSYTRVISASESTVQLSSVSSGTLLSSTYNFTDKNVYFYQSRGLINESLNTFCIPSAGKVISCKLIGADATSGSNIVVFEDKTGIPVGAQVIGFGVASGTTVASIDFYEDNTTPLPANAVRLNNNLTANIKAGATLTISTDGDKSLCCPPTDTSPPFEPTNEGLKTTDDYPVLGLNDGNLVFDNLNTTILSSVYTVGGVNQSNIVSYNESDTSNIRFKIRCNNGTYEILGKEIPTGGIVN